MYIYIRRKCFKQAIMVVCLCNLQDRTYCQTALNYQFVVFI